ncbi:hypothetical protein OH809_32230 [Streptomyces sp. NBC_00873]|uniref:hypothetical protein n=1 Tax=unclassified Streptomyces TaxID=2593676 RepID=UPI00386F53E6|nr:hypothetical protein OH809_32230 [Streptomyces sp. NBC_00873]WTA49097.1 hypothetical protein OH821_11490 [Streptomyces sp. NBC_00842]
MGERTAFCGPRPRRTDKELGLLLFFREPGPYPAGTAGPLRSSGMGGTPGTLERDAAHAASLGVNQLRLYHAGLASDPDIEAVAEALSRLGR